MFFCKQKFCEECGVAFKPVTGPFSDLCETHRFPKLAEHRRKNAVIYWANANWKRLEKQYLEEKALEDAKMQAYNQQAMASMAGMQNAAMQAAQSGQCYQNPFNR